MNEFNKKPTARRGFLGGAATLAAAGLASSLSHNAQAQAQTAPAAAAVTMAKTSTTDKIPMVSPQTEFVYEAIVDLDPTLQLGVSPFGDRRLVPIIGGTFEGVNGLRGKVLAGGADRQLVRRDGATNLDAIYELQTHDGVVISVRNRVLSRPAKDNIPRYAFSHIELTVQDGAYGWLNNFVYVGTLNSLRPERAAVVIRVYKVI